MQIRMSAKKKENRIGHSVLIHATLIIVSLFFVVPMLALIGTSLKSQAQNIQVPPMWIPSPAHPENYPQALAVVSFFTFLATSIFVTVMQVHGGVL